MMKREVIDKILVQKIENTESMIELLYECYASKATMDNEMIRDSFSVLERCTKDMPYEICDQISGLRFLHVWSVSVWRFWMVLY